MLHWGGGKSDASIGGEDAAEVFVAGRKLGEGSGVEGYFHEAGSTFENSRSAAC